MASSSKYSGYSGALQKYGSSPKAMKWHDYKSATIRYRQLLMGLDITGKTILDVGCGMGDILPFLYAKSDDFSYLGVDTEEGFIQIAQQRYDGHTFKVMDPFTEELNRAFDIVILCGALNHNQEGWLEDRKLKIKRLFELAREAVAFNMAGSFIPPSPSGGIAYVDVNEIVQFCTSLTPKIMLQTHYHDKDFSLTMFK